MKKVGKKDARRRLWHWNLDRSQVPEGWEFQPPDDTDIDVDDPDDSGHAYLSLNLSDDVLVLQSFGPRTPNRWCLYADEGVVVSWPDSEVVENTLPSLAAACKWALEVYLARLDTTFTALRCEVAARMQTATSETCAVVLTTLDEDETLDHLVAFVEQREAAEKALSRIVLP